MNNVGALEEASEKFVSTWTPEGCILTSVGVIREPDFVLPHKYSFKYFINYVPLTPDEAWNFTFQFIKPYIKYEEEKHEGFKHYTIESDMPLLFISICKTWKIPYKPIESYNNTLIFSVYAEPVRELPWYTIPHKLLQQLSYYWKFYYLPGVLPWEGTVFTSNDSEELQNPPTSVDIIETFDRPVDDMLVPFVDHQISNPISDEFMFIKQDKNELWTPVKVRV